MSIIAHVVGTLHVARQRQDTLRDRLGRAPVVVLTGARQTGKTTMVQHFADAHSRRYLTLDSLAVLERARREPEVLPLGKAPLTLDEVQRAPELFLAIKLEVDRSRRRGRFLLTGSANLLLMKSVSESLTGRASFLTLRPMTEREKHALDQPPVWDAFLAAKGVEEPLEQLPRARKLDWKEAALEGGLPPAALARDRDDRELWFQGYVDTYVQRDLRDLAQVADVGPFVRFAALRTNGLLNQANLAQDAAVPRSTVQRWLGLLQTTYVVTLLPAFAESRAKRLIKAPKLYPLDTGLALHLAGIREADELERAPLAGSGSKRWC
jgi:hypothetical protein